MTLPKAQVAEVKMTAQIPRRTFIGLSASAGLAASWTPAWSQDPLMISSVNYPLAYFAERLAGELAQVSFPVPADIDPSFWRPSISEITAVQNSDLILLNGASFADWTGRVSLPRSRVVNTSAAFETAYIATETVTHSHGDGGEHSHTGTASYVWLDFAQAAQQAAAISAAIIRRSPGSEGAVSRNLAALVDELSALDSQAREIGAASAGITVIASHPRYQYFARAYGFEIIALEWDPNEEPTEAQWQELEVLADDTQADVFFWEAQPSEDALLRMESSGLTSVVFAPLANTPESGDFLSAMAISLEEIRAALATPPTD